MIKRFADRLFRWFCRPEFYPDIHGDLEELYYDLSEQNKKTAQFLYLLEVLRLFRPALIRPLFKNSIFNSTGMFKNYFKISARNLIKHKAFSFINIIGLAIGLTAFLLINEYVRFEKSYDRFFTDSECIYRLTTDQVLNGVIGTRDAMSFAPSGPALVDQVPEVVSSTLTYQFNELVLRLGERSIKETKAIAADSNYFDLFDYKIVAGGDHKTMLKEPYSIVLTESRASAYFGEQNPIGQTVRILSGFDQNFKVTGVIQDVPENTHYKFDVLVSIVSFQEDVDEDGWRSFNYYTYLKLAKGTNIDDLRAKFPRMHELSGEEESESNLEFNLQPIEDIHLYSDFTYEPEVHGNANTVRFLVIISLLIIVVAWVNYINLSTARAIDRAREVGVRKAIGARKKQLVTQFLFESLLINLIAALFAILLTQLLYPNFNQLIGKEILHNLITNQDFLLKVLAFAAIGAIVSGIYPAFVLSNFNTVTVLKGKFRNSAKGVWLRKALVIVQFAVSLVLLAATFVIQRQVNYMQAADKGIDMDHVIGFRRPAVTSANRADMKEKLKQFKQTLLNHHAIDKVGMAGVLPGGSASEISSTTGEVQILGITDAKEGTTYLQRCDDSYLDAAGVRLIAGRNFNANLATDTAAIIVNESYLKRLGVHNIEEVLNQQIRYGDEEDGQKYHLIGIIADYHRTSLKNSVEPTATFFYEMPGYVVLRLDETNYRDGIQFLEETYQSYFPNTPLDYAFLDERFKSLFYEDQQFGKIIATFSLLAVIVASLGLFGLSAFMAMNRSKEVGIRKVLGASISQILFIFYKEFLVLLSIAALIGVPLTYYAMENWLNSYAFRIGFPWVFIMIAIVAVITTALIAVGYQTLRVAVKNPSETLRYE